MSIPLPIKFLLKQLEKVENRERFNSISFFKCEYAPRIKEVSFGGIALGDNPVKLEYVIRRCLSRVNGEAVIDVFDELEYKIYKSFDTSLFNGESLDEAIEACHWYMIGLAELLPEYQEFCKNN